MIKLLLAHQAKVNTICAQGSTALFYAIQKGHVDAVDLLLDNEADYTIRNTIGCDAMLAASVYDKTLIIELLLQKGVSPNTKAEHFTYPILRSIEKQDNKLVELLLDHDADPNSKDNENQSALHMAAGLGNIALVNLLLKKGASVTAQNQRGNIPLHSASHHKRFLIVQILLEHGADVDLRNNLDATPASIAVEAGSLRCLRELIKTRESSKGIRSHKTAKEDAPNHYPLYVKSHWFHLAASGKPELEVEQIHIISFLLGLGVDVNHKDLEGRTGLHHATRGGKAAMVRFLLEQGATHAGDHQDQTCRGGTPLDIAKRLGSQDIVTLLEADVAELPFLPMSLPAVNPVQTPTDEQQGPSVPERKQPELNSELEASISTDPPRRFAAPPPPAPSRPGEAPALPPHPSELSPAPLPGRLSKGPKLSGSRSSTRAASSPPLSALVRSQLTATNDSHTSPPSHPPSHGTIPDPPPEPKRCPQPSPSAPLSNAALLFSRSARERYRDQGYIRG